LPHIQQQQHHHHHQNTLSTLFSKKKKEELLDIYSSFVYITNPSIPASDSLIDSCIQGDEIKTFILNFIHLSIPHPEHEISRLLLIKHFFLFLFSFSSFQHHNQQQSQTSQPNIELLAISTSHHIGSRHTSTSYPRIAQITRFTDQEKP